MRPAFAASAYVAYAPRAPLDCVVRLITAEWALCCVPCWTSSRRRFLCLRLQDMHQCRLAVRTSADWQWAMSHPAAVLQAELVATADAQQGRPRVAAH